MLLSFAAAAVTSFALTIAVRALAPHIGLVDRPDGHRKLHSDAKPLGGGAAVFLATALVLATLLLVANPWQAALRESARNLGGLLAAGLIIVLVGLLDDRIRLRGRHKLLGQVIAITVLVTNGLMIERVGILGSQFDLGMLAIPFTFFWLLGATNSINLLDGIDGLATLLGLVLVTTLAVMAWLVGQTEIALVALVFAGALAGFLWFNLPPASIFLGDAGSMLIGLIVGALAIQGSLKGPGTVLLAAPLAVWTLPILDCTAAILRRKLTGRSVYATDRGHLHHMLLQRLGSVRRVLAIVTVCCLLTSSAALVSVYLQKDLIAFLVGPAVVAVFVITGMFGRAELVLLFNRLRALIRSFLVHNGHLTSNGWSASSESAVHLQGSARWKDRWTELIDQADEMCLTYVRLDINLPMLHESYSAVWERPFQDDSQKCWCLEVPLLVAEQRVGHVRASGHAGGADAHQGLGRLVELIAVCESHMAKLIADNVHLPIAGNVQNLRHAQKTTPTAVP
jgi:UDP-GlcNAc:undecaprenyl-phosphate GlcNAc-1-phosphate transferase